MRGVRPAKSTASATQLLDDDLIAPLDLNLIFSTGTPAMKPDCTSLDRRDFLRSASALGLGAGAGLANLGTGGRVWAQDAPASNVLGANDTLRVGVIGFGGRGQYLLGAIDAAEGAEVVAICDVDTRNLEREAANRPDAFATQDLRELLDRNDIDAIASATPNHWHALLTIWACQAGKHVYIEKPISYNIAEGQAIVAAANHHGSVVQAGYQNRSDAALLPFFADLHAGRFGAVQRVHGTCYRPRNTIGKRDTPLTPPTEVDYNLWLGPAADVPMMRENFHYDWHWDFNTGNGDIGNQGPHELDMIFWALNDPTELPRTVRAAGNRFAWGDAGNTPNVMATSLDFGGIPACFEVMDLTTGRRPPYHRGVGVIIYTEQGKFVGGRGGGRFAFNDGEVINFGGRGTGTQGQDGGQSHMQNFIDAARAGDNSNLRSEATVATRSAAVAHMANIAFRIGAETTTETLEGAFSNDLTQRDMIARLRESTYMFVAENGLGMPAEPWILSPEMTFDTASMQFTGDQAEAANAMIARPEERPGFEIPVI